MSLELAILSGSFGGAFSTGGSPVAAYLTSRFKDKLNLKASISLFLVALSLYKIPILAANGLITIQVLCTFLILSPSMAVSAILGAPPQGGLSCSIDCRMHRGCHPRSPRR